MDATTPSVDLTQVIELLTSINDGVNYIANLLYYALILWIVYTICKILYVTFRGFF